jgi:hypothetical protein
MPAVFVVLVLLAIALLAVWSALRRARRADFIRTCSLPRGLFEKLRARHPQISLKDCQLVAQALRQFFLAYLKGGGRTVAMPSQVADDLWHEFILNTRNYEFFCRRAFGRFQHHTPAAAMGGERRSNEGLRRWWWQCCRAENINPTHPSRLPLLFAIDTKLSIAGGFRYAPDCGPLKATASASPAAVVIHCGGDFSDGSFDGGTDGFGEGGGNAGTEGGDGDSGGSCGGGCSS